ncbi:septum site-determining protein MinC [Allopusillimonas ginsengisoli]|nr:septum site-determining protein MinC [Allopusillimonas ginsengisoli]
MSESTRKRKGQPALDFKSATLYAVRVVLNSHDIDTLVAALDIRMRDAGSFFEHEPVVIDSTAVEQRIDWSALLQALQGHNLHPVGVVATGDNLEGAQQAGLTAVDLANPVPRPTSTPAPDSEVPVVAPPPAGQDKPKQAASKRSPDSPAADDAKTAAKTPEDNKAEPARQLSLPEIAPAAMVINRPLRSGQRIYARDTDLIIIGVVSQGAEVIADGNIHVYGPLRGKAMAGARGDTRARIFTTQLDPELLAIAGVYRVIETRLDDSLKNQPAIIQLDEDDALHITALGK